MIKCVIIAKNRRREKVMYTLLTYKYDEAQDLLEIEGLFDTLLRDVYVRTEKAHLLDRAYETVKENFIAQLIKAKQASKVVVDILPSRFESAILHFGKASHLLDTAYPIMEKYSKQESDENDKTQVIIDYIYSTNQKYIGINFDLPISTEDNRNELNIDDMDVFVDEYAEICKQKGIEPKTYNGLDYIAFYKDASLDMLTALRKMDLVAIFLEPNQVSDELMRVCEYCLEEMTFDDDYKYALNCALMNGVLIRPEENHYNLQGVENA